MRAVIDGQSFAFVDRSLTVSKSVGIYELEFEFDDSWSGFDKTAVFEGSGQTIEVVVSDGKARIPWEVLTKNGLLKVGVYGTQDEKIKPTIWGENLVVRLGTPTGSIGTEPTPSIYAQILAVADEAKEIAQEAYSRAVTAQDSAEASAENAEAWAVGQRNGQDVSPTDETYHNNSKWYAELARQGAEEAGYAWFDIDESDGYMYVTVTDNLAEDVRFEINEQTGELEVIVA